MPKHTPGPWRVDFDGTSTGRSPVILGEDAYYDDGSPRQIAELETCEVRPKGFGKWKRKDEAGEIHANAHLIAAAPEMLDALEYARRTLAVAVRAGLSGFTEKETDDIVTNHSTIKAIDAAISKAKGGAA